MNEKEREPIYEDEIDLYELWLKLKKRWKVILGTVVLFVLSAVVYLLTTKPVYVSSFVIKIGWDPVSLLSGNVPKELILLPEELASLINAKASTLNIEGIKSINAKSLLKRRGVVSTVKVTIEAYDKEAIQKAYEELMHMLNTEKFINEKIKALKLVLDKRVNRLKDMLREAYKHKSTAEKNHTLDYNPVEVNKIISDLEKELVYTEYLIKESKPFEVLYKPIIPSKPSKPKRSLVLTVAAVSGLFLGIFLALFLEWVEEARKAHRERELRT